jgi:ribonucleoside-diphosphate reductase alpha chain
MKATTDNSNNTEIKAGKALSIERFFTEPGTAAFDTVDWELRTASVGNFEQKDVEFPTTWSQNATNIVSH